MDSSRTAVPDLVATEVAMEQAHVDRVYAELERASARARMVAAEGLARGRTERVGQARFDEMTGLFERDALVFHAARRQHTLDSQYEGLVFGRLDLEQPDEREVRYIGRIGVRDEDYEPLVIDWRAPAASPFYRATPVEPLGVLRRRVLRCRGPEVIGVEDDLMVPEAPDDLVVVGDGALMAALTRTRGAQMRDIVATIQRHQDEAIRAPAHGITEIVGGPGTGKTVVALHRAAYLLYADRRRYESGGILVIGPSAAYTAYIERVLPSLGEDSVALRALGDVVDAVTTQRHDHPAAAAVKGSLRMREVLARAARDGVPGAPDRLRVFVAGYAVHLDAGALAQVRRQALRAHARNQATEAVTHLLGEAAWRQARHERGDDRDEREDFIDRFTGHRDVEEFLHTWWPQVDPREVLLWLADRERLERYARGVLRPGEVDTLHASMTRALELGEWSISDVALIDEVSAKVGVVNDITAERGYFEIDEMDALLRDVRPLGEGDDVDGPVFEVTPQTPRDRLLHGRIGRTPDYAHVLVDEAQDLSPMQWRMIGRRGRTASWTVVGDAAQSSWPAAEEAARARATAWGEQPYRRFRMTTNYRNAREIFDYAAQLIRRHVPDADIPDAVRETGIDPVEAALGEDPRAAVEAAALALADEVGGSVAVITPARYAEVLAPLDGSADGRVRVIDPMSAKGLEWDATVVVNPDEIVAESPGGARVLYVALTRAAHRMTVLSRS